MLLIKLVNFILLVDGTFILVNKYFQKRTFVGRLEQVLKFMNKIVLVVVFSFINQLC